MRSASLALVAVGLVIVDVLVVSTRAGAERTTAMPLWGLVLLPVILGAIVASLPPGLVAGLIGLDTRSRVPMRADLPIRDRRRRSVIVICVALAVITVATITAKPGETQLEPVAHSSSGEIDP